MKYSPRVKLQRLFFNKVFLHIEVSKPRTLWWRNIKQKNIRTDNLIGLDREYSRQYKVYLYIFICWRLKITWSVLS